MGKPQVDEAAVVALEVECKVAFAELAVLQKAIRGKLAEFADGKNLKGNEIVGWLGEIYDKLLLRGRLVDDREEHDLICDDGLRVSVKTRKGWNSGWRQTSAIPRTEGTGCPTHLLFVHLNDDYSIDRLWLFEWRQLLTAGRFRKHNVRGSQRSFIFIVDERQDASCVVYQCVPSQALAANSAEQRARPAGPDTASLAKEVNSMNEFEKRGSLIKGLAADLVIEYMRGHTDARPTGKGVKQATIFQECGFSWGPHEKATESNQQYWIVGTLNHLRAKGLVLQIRDRGPWRLAE